MEYNIVTFEQKRLQIGLYLLRVHELAIEHVQRLKQEERMQTLKKASTSLKCYSTRRLQVVIKGKYDALKHDIDVAIQKLENELYHQGRHQRCAGLLACWGVTDRELHVPLLGRISYVNDEEIAHLICDLESLYQWIHDEDQLVSQEAVDNLLQLFVRLLRLYTAENDHRGGFRNLLLDGWWLEFWEIILLAAGDVERHPGPGQITDEELTQVSDRLIENDDLSEVLTAVHPINSKWSIVCCYLGLESSSLDAIEKNHRGDVKQCFIEGLKYWLQQSYNTEKHGAPTWRKLVKAIDHPAGGENHALALEIAKKYKKSDPLQATEDSTVAVSDIAKKRKAVAAIGVACSNSDSTDRIRSRRSQKMSRSSAFKTMYRSVLSHMSMVDVGEVKASLRYLTNPQCPKQLCVPRRVYQNATTTKDLLDRLCPTYVNPEDTFVLEEIINEFGSRRCKKELHDYIDEFL